MSTQDNQKKPGRDSRGAVILVNTLALPSLQRLQTVTQIAPRKLHIVFNASWAEPLAISAELSGYTRDAHPEGRPNVLSLEMDPSRPLSASIEVKSLGEYLEPVHYVYELENGGSLIARPSGSLCMDFDDFSLSLSGERADAFLFGAREYLEALDPLVRGDTSPLGPARRFFSELDKRAEARLREVAVTDAERVPTRNHMTGLFYAISGRFGERHGKMSHAPYSQRANVRADVQHVSTMMLDLARKHFPEGPMGISRERFALAFEMFANGELRLLVPPFDVWSNQPSSGYYFYFAELAFLAIECNIDAPEWLPLLNVLVRTQEIYCTAYAPAMPATERQLWDYKACNFSERKQLDESAKAALRSTYSSITTHQALSLRSSKNAKDFVGGF